MNQINNLKYNSTQELFSLIENIGSATKGKSFEK